jgi:hypothetical protein
MNSVSSTSNADRATYRVMMAAHPPGERSRHSAGRLASWLGLDVYGNSLLHRRGVLEMRFMALILVIIALFELGAWTLLFNAIFHSELLDFGWGTLLAMLPASLFAGAVLIYERQFVSTDLSAGFFRLLAPIGLRLLVILASALITAQPVELLIFRGQILQRVHEEGIRLEVVTRLEQYRRAEEVEERNLEELREIETGTLVLREDKILQEAADKRQEQRDRATELRAEEARAQNNVNYWAGIVRDRRNALSAARGRDASAAEIAGLESRLSEAVGNRDAWGVRRDKARSELQLVEQRIVDYTADLEKAETDFEEQRSLARRRRQENMGSAERTRERLAEWINQLRNAQPEAGETIVETFLEGPATVDEEVSEGESTGEVREPYRYTLPKYDFFEQLRVLRDLRHGFPPSWQGVSEERAAELADLYSLVDVRPCADQVVEGGPRAAADKDCDRGLWERQVAEAQQFDRSYWIVFFIALVIPFLVIASKLLMTPELKAYYSSRAQAASGNPVALAFQSSTGGGGGGRVLRSMMGTAENENE